ncbi:sigma-54 dependent transcriptional regulator [Rhodobacter sp. KR11]|uniref:sigma-54-dependent transcriptional regulator n=1 Tax=Rhodobacter sp. KR11 TaxID=2974588 RepID=UPI00222282E7|nr:sigma-54 dependent transcriptional regulator [Rhodobacter sp. KR11]MCW1918735.1 sigma-54 dependent transcriptional regulator [Rhodobacter sp. KR11]
MASAPVKPAAFPAAAKAGPLLLIEDTASLQLIYRSVLQAAGYEVHLAATAAEGQKRFAAGHHRVVLLDLGLPDRDGLQVMTEMLQARPDTRIIVITAHGSINRAVEAMRAGAHEFLVKPFEDERFLSAVANAVARSQARKPAGDAAAGFLGSSEVMGRIHDKIASVAGSMATVFITGESGTGKELAALAVHGASPRAKGPFIALNCGAIPHDLLESEVFGHVKGSFTGAISDKPGAATAADGGTLFLDEICEMAPALQTKLLRFLQTSTVLPVGATKPIKVNVRIVCATNRDPLDAVRRGHFREDLYYRLFVVPIHLPPLRDRGEDIIEIAETMLTRFAEEEGRRFDGLAPEVTELFRRQPWPGNVRQLLNVIRNVVVLNPGGLVTLDMLPETLTAPDAGTAPPERVLTPDAPALDSLLDRPLAEVERLIVTATLSRHGGSVPKAARVLDISPSTLYRKLEAWARAEEPNR